MAGEIWVDGQRVIKASHPCPAEAQILRQGADQYVSRGGHKLEAGLKAFHINPQGKVCLDLGASTGGFTDCLLQQGAAKVVCVDVGQGQLHWKLRQDPRVEVREGINARFLRPADFSCRFPVIVADLSFISLRLVLPAAFGLLESPGTMCVLVKPQFEAGRQQVGKGGIVRDSKVHDQVQRDLEEWVSSFPVKSLGMVPSPLEGRDGNREFLWGLAR